MSFSANVEKLVGQSNSPLVQKAEQWVRSPLGEVAVILNGFPFKSDFFNGSQGDPIIRIRDVTSGRTETRYSGPAMEGFWVEAGDLIVGMDGDFNSRVWSGPPALLNQRVCKITPDERILNRRFLAYLLPGYLRLINEETHSVTVKHLSSRTLQELPLPLAPLAEQQRVVAKLDALTGRTARARADLDRIPALASRYKKIVLAKAFSGELTAAWRLKRAAGEPKPSRLADLVSAPIRNGLSVRGSDDPPGVRSLRLSALRGGQVNMDDVRFLPISSDKADRFLLEEGDILISRGNGTKALVGICALVPSIKSPTIFPDTAFRLRAARDRVVPRWLTYIWSAPQVRAQVEAIAKTTAGIWKVSQGDLAGIELTLVDKEEQVEIVRRVDAAFAEIDRLTTEAAAARRLLDRLDQAIMAKAFRGELVPQDPADEPANVLLERIRTERAAAPKAKRGRPSRLGNNEVEAA